MLRNFLLLILLYVKPKSSNIYNFLKKNYMLSLNDVEKKIFFEYQLEKTKEIIQKRAARKIEYRQQIHICIGLKNYKAEEKNLKEYKELKNYISHLNGGNEFSGFLTNFVVKNKINQLIANQTVRENLRNLTKNLFKELPITEDIFNLVFRLYFVNKIINKFKKTKTLNVDKEIMFFNVFFWVFSNIDDKSFDEFLSGEINDKKFLNIDKYIKNEADIFVSQNFLRLTLLEIKSFNRIILMSIPITDYNNLKIDNLLEKIVCLRTNKKSNMIKICKINLNTKDDFTIDKTIFKGKFSKILRNKLAIIFTEKVFNNETNNVLFFKPNADFKFIKKDEKIDTTRFSKIIDNVLSVTTTLLYELDLCYCNHCTKIKLFKISYEYKEFYEIKYLFCTNENILFKFKFLISKKEHAHIKNSYIQNLKVYEFLKNLLIITENSFEFYTRIFDKKIQI